MQLLPKDSQRRGHENRWPLSSHVPPRTLDSYCLLWSCDTAFERCLAIGPSSREMVRLATDLVISRGASSQSDGNVPLANETSISKCLTRLFTISRPVLSSCILQNASNGSGLCRRFSAISNWRLRAITASHDIRLLVAISEPILCHRFISCFDGSRTLLLVALADVGVQLLKESKETAEPLGEMKLAAMGFCWVRKMMRADYVYGLNDECLVIYVCIYSV